MALAFFKPDASRTRSTSLLKAFFITALHSLSKPDALRKQSTILLKAVRGSVRKLLSRQAKSCVVRVAGVCLDVLAQRCRASTSAVRTSVREFALVTRSSAVRSRVFADGTYHLHTRDRQRLDCVVPFWVFSCPPLSFNAFFIYPLRRFLYVALCSQHGTSMQQVQSPLVEYCEALVTQGAGVQLRALQVRPSPRQESQKKKKKFTFPFVRYVLFFSCPLRTRCVSGAANRHIVMFHFAHLRSCVRPRRQELENSNRLEYARKYPNPPIRPNCTPKTSTLPFLPAPAVAAAPAA